jgi:pimeloyl-ACP methyl ester carboxylesterase
MECKLEDISVHYELHGDGRPMVSLHGFWLDHHSLTGCMEPIFERRDGWKRLYPDLPGMGKTPSKGWITNSDQMLDVMLAFIDKLMPNQHFVLAGESYGGYLARGIVQHRSELVDGLLLICPMVIADSADRTLPPHTVLVKNPTVMSTLNPEEREEFESIAVVQSQRIWERTRDEFNVGVAQADEPFLSTLQEDGYQFSFDVDASPAEFQKPTLILMGRQDAAVGYRDAWELVEKYPRGTFAVLDKAGHLLHLEQESLFNSLVCEWLDRIEDGSA